MIKKYIDETWDFRNENTKRLTHCFHNYPAIMIPQVASRLIERYSKKPKLLFDPYCGSGTSLVEAMKRGIDSIGTDLNPLARLLSKVKTTPLDLDALIAQINIFSEEALKQSFGIKRPEELHTHRFENINFWFDTEIQKELDFIRHFISKIQNQKIADFFKVPFSETVRECSWTRNSEFKLYRMTEKQRADFRPKTLAIMESKLRRAFTGLKELQNELVGNAKVEVHDFNTVKEIPKHVFKNRKVDIVVTSPPYGDSHTTVAYGQYSRLSSEWLGFGEARQVDRMLMGGKQNGGKVHFKCEKLADIIGRIRAKDSQRAGEVISFYNDYWHSIMNVSALLSKGGYACYVVGNRKVKGEVLPTDEITREFFEFNGFEHIETIIRNIPNKRMPSKNSPSNVAGELDSTMTNEFIVVMEKVS